MAAPNHGRDIEGDDRVPDLMAALEDSIARAREARRQQDERRKAEVRRQMDAGEFVYLGDAMWASDGRCLDEEPEP